MPKTIFEDDFRTLLAKGRRRISWRRRFSKTIFGPFWRRGEDELVGEDDFRRRFSDPFGQGAKTKLAGEDDFRRRFSDPLGRGAKTN